MANVETCFDPELRNISCHAGEFNQVILNMIVNAAHAIEEAHFTIRLPLAGKAQAA